MPKKIKFIKEVVHNKIPTNQPTPKKNKKEKKKKKTIEQV